jgi:hypothetical protein
VETALLSAPHFFAAVVALFVFPSFFVVEPEMELEIKKLEKQGNFKDKRRRR